jgi:hypothetical protein
MMGQTTARLPLYLRRSERSGSKRRRVVAELPNGLTVTGVTSGISCHIAELLGAGRQSEIYLAARLGEAVEIAWYPDAWRAFDTTLRDRLQELVDRGAPSDRFIWPKELVTSSGAAGIGCLTNLANPDSLSLGQLAIGTNVSLGAAVNIGYELAESVAALHAKGLCYAVIDDNDVAADPVTGHIEMWNFDNVLVDGTPARIRGGGPFVAPEVVLQQRGPSRYSDLYSLAVLLFTLLISHHPLHGGGEELLFIFDPEDESNRPVPGRQDRPLLSWTIYPQFIRDLFTRAFTAGLREREARVDAVEWRNAMLRLRDSRSSCPLCEAEVFSDAAAVDARCWNCRSELGDQTRA